MKKLLSLVAICISLTAFAQNNVTFSVDMNSYAGPTYSTVEVSGNFAGWCAGCIIMSETAPGSGVYTVDVDLPAGPIEYKFTLDAFVGQENLIPGTSCTITTGGFTNRFADITGSVDLGVVCWESCNACGVSTNADLTVSVDMNEYAGAYTNVYVSGTFNGWSGNANPMTETAPGSGVYTTTINVPQGQHEYKFTLDDWTAQEALTPGTACVLTTSGFTNRVVQVTSNTSAALVCWESCDACGVDNDSDVTFRVDMNQYTATFTQVYVSGSFNGWCGDCNPMTDANNDGVYEVTLNLTNASHEYKFTLDNWAVSENFVGGESCTLTTGSFTNRLIVVSADVTTPAYCWESCDACSGGGCMAPTGMDVVEIGFGGTNPKVNATWMNPEGTTSCEVRGGRISAATAGTANPAFVNIANTLIINQTNGTSVNFNITLYNNPNIPFETGKTYGYEVRCACSDGSGFSDWSGLTPGATFVVPGLPVASHDGSASAKLLEAGMNAMSIYPNPTDGIVNIQMEMLEASSVEIALINALGQTVLQERNSGENMTTTMDVSTVEAGIYMLSVRTATGLVTERLIVR